MIFFTDECFMYPANALLEAFDRVNEIRALMDYFDRGTPDTVWLGSIAGWNPKPMVICGDGRILRNKVGRQALKDAAMTFFCLSSGWMHLDWSTFGWKIVKAWPGIVAEANRVIRPTVFEVSAQTLKISKAFHLE